MRGTEYGMIKSNLNSDLDERNLSDYLQLLAHSSPARFDFELFWGFVSENVIRDTKRFDWISRGQWEFSISAKKLLYQFPMSFSVMNDICWWITSEVQSSKVWEVKMAMRHCIPKTEYEPLTYQIALMRVFVKLANFTTKPRFRISNLHNCKEYPRVNSMHVQRMRKNLVQTRLASLVWWTKDVSVS